MNESRRLTYRHRGYLAKYFFNKEFGTEYNIWSKNQSIMKEYAKKIRNLILECMGLVKGKEFLEFYNRNPSMFNHLQSLIYIPDLIDNLNISKEGLAKIIQNNVVFPASKDGSEVNIVDIINNSLPSLDIRSGGELPFIDCFSSGLRVVIPSNIEQNYLYRELQNTVIEFCIKFLSNPAVITTYFYGVSWDPIRIDVRTFLMPQKISTFKDLKKDYPNYYNQLKIKFWNEFCYD